MGLCRVRQSLKLAWASQAMPNVCVSMNSMNSKSLRQSELSHVAGAPRRVEQDLSERLVPDHLFQDHARVERDLGIPVAVQRGEDDVGS